MDPLSKYIEEKKHVGCRFLKSSVNIEKRYVRVFGARSLYGVLRISAGPSASFSFESKAKWPSENCDGAIMIGILDVLLSESVHPILGMSVTVEEIEWHEVDSSYFAYYEAAKAVAKEIVSTGDFEDHVSHARES